MFILILFIIMVLASLFSFAFTDRRREYALIATAIFLIATIVYSILRFSTGYGSGGFRSESVYNLAPSIGIAFSIGVSGFADALLIAFPGTVGYFSKDSIISASWLYYSHYGTAWSFIPWIFLVGIHEELQ